jgi:hypothetical protein
VYGCTHFVQSSSLTRARHYRYCTDTQFLLHHLFFFHNCPHPHPLCPSARPPATLPPAAHPTIPSPPFPNSSRLHTYIFGDSSSSLSASHRCLSSAARLVAPMPRSPSFNSSPPSDPLPSKPSSMEQPRPPLQKKS